LGRPGYNPALHLKLYIYGYLHRIQSSRRLERECQRNLEVMWLLGRLAPDHKTIADFRKDNGAAIKKVCAQFVELCRRMGLLAKASVAIDGSKFKAVNNRDKNYTVAKIERRRTQLETSVARYLSQLDTADLQDPSETVTLKKTHLKGKLEKLKSEMQKLEAIERQVLASPDQQISLTDPDSRSMATSGRGSGVVGYNVQTAVDTQHHLIVAHEVTNVGNDTAHLANTAKAAKAALHVDEIEAVADRGYFDSEEILACDLADITVTLPKRMTSGAKSEGRFGKQDFVYLADEDVYRCPAGEKLKYYYTNEEKGQKLHRYWTNACRTCALKAKCTKGPQRRIARWEHEEVLESVQARLDRNPDAMRTRRETVEHPFGTIKMRMGATHFLMKTLPKVATEMALCVLTYNLTRVLNIVGVENLMEAIKA
jgi:transposase